MRVVASLTTIPSGIPGAVEVIKALLKNKDLDLIYLNLPYIYGKTGEKYPIFPFRSPKLVINRCEDLGPITKIYHTLEKETDPETRILILDDDNIPLENIVSNFMKYSVKYPNAALTTGGWIRGGGVLSFQNFSGFLEGVREVDWVEGSGGIFVPRKFFSGDLLDYRKAGALGKLFKKHDDHWISWTLRDNGAALLSIPEVFSDQKVSTEKTENISGSLSFCKEVYQLSTFLRDQGIYRGKSDCHPLPKSLLFLLAVGLLLLAVGGYMFKRSARN